MPAGTRLKGSQDIRSQVFAEVEAEIKAVNSEEQAIALIHENISRAGQMEHGCISRLKENRRIKYIKLYETAAQLAIRWRIFPEIILDYAYRLRLLGEHSSSFRLADAVDINRGLFKREGTRE